MTQSVSPDTTELRERVSEIIAQELEITVEELAPEASFEEQYDADSLALLAVVARFERDLGVVVPTDEVARMTTLSNVYELVDEYGAVSSGG